MYEKFYGFAASPFQLSPDHRFFFESSVHRTALAHLTYGLSQGEGFIIITGEVGAGKTTLVGHLFETLDKQRFVAARVVSTQLQADDMLRMVAAAFGLPIAETNKAALLRLVESFLLSNQQQGKRCLLVVDEAQNLSVAALEELRMLSNFQAGSQAPLQSFLLGQPQFRSLLASPDLDQLRQRVIASYHLGPLAPAETRAYMEHRLRAVGWKQDPVIADNAYSAIYSATGGVPRRINTLCSRILLLGFLEESHHIDRDHVERVASELRRELEFQSPARNQAAADPVSVPRSNHSPESPLRMPAPAVPVHSADRAMPAALQVAEGVSTTQVQPDTPDSLAPQRQSSEVLPLPGSTEGSEGDAQTITAGSYDLGPMLERITVLEATVAAQTEAINQHDRLLRQALSVATTLLDLNSE